MMNLIFATILPVLISGYCTGDWYCRNTAWFGWDYTCEKQGSGGWDAWNCVKTKNNIEDLKVTHQFYPVKGCTKQNWLAQYYNTDRDECLRKCDKHPRCKAFYMYSDDHCQLISCNRDYSANALCDYYACYNEQECGFECDSADMYIKDDHYDANYVPRKVAQSGTIGGAINNMDSRLNNLEANHYNGRRRMQCLHESKKFERPQQFSVSTTTTLTGFGVQQAFCTLTLGDPRCELTAEGEEWGIIVGDGAEKCKVSCSKLSTADHCI